MRPVFADPKTDFVFKKLFSSEPHKHLVIALLNDLLELDHDHRIVSLSFVATDLRPQVAELKLSIVDVKCIDARGTQYVVEMQVLNVEGFERRVVYNTSKAYVGQLRAGEEYPQLNDVVGVSICDFELWPHTLSEQVTAVPMLSRWRMQEQHTGARALGQIQYVFLELPKYAAGQNPISMVDKWAYLFREAERLAEVPATLAGSAQAEALEEARMAHWTADEWDAYDRAKVAEQDARGALTLAHRQGLDEGRQQGLDEGRQQGLDEGKRQLEQELRKAIADMAELLGITLTEAQRARLASFETERLKTVWDEIKARRQWPDDA